MQTQWAPGERITIAEVRASINPKMEVHPSVSIFGRPLANLITPGFHNRGWTANNMTVARSWMAIGGMLLLAFPDPHLWQLSVGIYYLNFVLDCVDGNLARVQNDASYYGKFLDGVSDFIYPSLSAFVLGIGCWLYFDQPLAIILGACITIASVSNQMVRNRLSFFREWMVGLTGKLTEEELAKAVRVRKFQQKMAFLLVNGYFIAILLLLVPNPLWAVIGFFSISIVTQLVPETMWFFSNLLEGAAILKRRRRSKSSSIQTSK
jgi:phosphatidylglycerophosphate synthase